MSQQDVLSVEDFGKAGGPAFPLVHEVLPDGRGMSLRDYFAGQALQGLLASTDAHSALPDAGPLAKHAYRFADAMLAERVPNR